MRLIGFLAAHAIIGVMAGWIVLALVLALDIGGLGDLALRAEHVWIALPLLAAGFAVTFGGCAAATGVMLLPRDAGAPDAGRGPPSRDARDAPAPGRRFARVQIRIGR